MATCEYRTSCGFFNKMVAGMPNTIDDLRDKYCNGDFSKCARFMISKTRGIDNVPDNLSPNSFDRQKCFCGM